MILEVLREINEQALLADGFEDAFIGIAFRANLPPIASYDYGKCVRILMSQGMTEDEATEYMEYNVVGSYVGENTPVFTLLEEDVVRYDHDETLEKIINGEYHATNQTA